ncbi:precorrin-6y C5,15-methyltransferase (decarboxylating) subunit CbiE [Azospirillum sp. TSO22-1]|uniref:precorrin-6y C5,15-methyltransferase (decarboxylating) subunit CbiE n=1 Tax=Azospirillum sp. TSO22-1 TaxID=716789 RepID=UPI000D61E003|nr:precorrin-6y C5,15-methyltransferase (decarboxylating) subunit CbiE [Azospirillum sp. TSO22-1]PWC57066.1 precorrin-6Y C5,15-methyltransferase [Azospirillum sp. TSO22-1]
MSEPWLTIIGIGEDGVGGLSEAALRAITVAEVLVGGERHLAMLPEHEAERLPWPSPFDALIDTLERRRNARVVVLASGDPMLYGVGTTLLNHFPIAETVVMPAPSAFALACARLGWARAEVECLTLHGRPVELLHPALHPGARILALSADGTTPAAVAALLRGRGYGPSRITVLERMGHPVLETRVAGTAADWVEQPHAALNTIAIECVAEPGAALLPRTPGLPDDAFRHDGQLTKREVRAVTLSALLPVPGQCLWDVGAGCGSVAIEWMRAAPRARAVAVEPRADRLALIAENAAALGVPGLKIVEGTAPAALNALPTPDAVFVGGGITAPGVVEACWEALPPGGRFVANAVTLEGERALIGLYGTLGGSLTQLSVSRAADLGGFTGWKPFRPVTQLAVIKP